MLLKLESTLRCAADILRGDLKQLSIKLHSWNVIFKRMNDNSKAEREQKKQEFLS